jgi:hypothetical protein
VHFDFAVTPAGLDRVRELGFDDDRERPAVPDRIFVRGRWRGDAE